MVEARDGDIEYLAQRIAQFDPDGNLMAETREVWEVMKDLPNLADRFRAGLIKMGVSEAAADGSASQLLPGLANRFTPEWLREVRAKMSVATGEAGWPSIARVLWYIYEAQHEALRDIVKDDPARLARLQQSLNHQSMLECDLWVAE